MSNGNAQAGTVEPGVEIALSIPRRPRWTRRAAADRKAVPPCRYGCQDGISSRRTASD